MTRLSSAAILTTALLCLSGFSCGGGSFATPDGTITHVAQSLHDNQPEVLWDALPPSYQQDVIELRDELCRRFDPELYEQIFRLIGKTSQLLSVQKSNILSSSMLQAKGLDKETASQHWDGLVAFLDLLTASDLASLDRLAAVEPHSFMATTGHSLMLEIGKSSEVLESDPYNQEIRPKLARLEAEVVGREEDRVMVQVSAPGEEPKVIEMVQVEQRWLPVWFVERWQTGVAEAHQELARLDEQRMAEIKAQSAFLLGAVEATLDQLTKAKSAEEIDQSMAGLMLMGQTLLSAR